MATMAVPAGATPEADGIALGEGVVTVDAFIDFLCPFCRMFEERSGPALEAMVDDHLITLVYHPLGLLDGLSTTGYSSRAGAASGCASDGGRFLPYLHALYDNQPPEGGPGLSDTELVVLGRGVGLAEPAFANCVMSGHYLPWVAFVTARAIERGVSGTPATYVDGVSVPANAQMIAAAVAARVGA